MSYTIDTTKRKFHRLLDSLTNASSTSLPSTLQERSASITTLPATLESPAKKLRMDRPGSADVRASPRSIATSVGGSPLAGRKATVKIVGEHKSPNFGPLDRAQFLARLKTFRHVDKWTSKPVRVNEVEWAKRGWSCVGRDRVGCVGGCDRELVIKLESTPEPRADDTEADVDDGDWSAGVNEQLVERYAEMIVTAHDEYCLWRKRACDGPFSPERLELRLNKMLMVS